MERSPARHDELAALRIGHLERAAPVAVQPQLGALDLEQPRLRIVAGRCEDRVLQEKTEPLRGTRPRRERGLLAAPGLRGIPHRHRILLRPNVTCSSYGSAVQV